MVNAQQWLDEKYPINAEYDFFNNIFSSITNMHNLGKRRAEVRKIDIWAWEGLEGSLSLEGFDNLEDFNCWGNSLAELDLTGAPNLRKVNCSSNYLRKLNVGNLRGLEELDCSKNRLTELDISGCPNLKNLNLTGNHLTIDQIRQKESLAVNATFITQNFHHHLIVIADNSEGQVAQIEFPPRNQ